ncbi:hypothetical protein QBC37DRAFT_375646 [Rhypophila decipiens]|uniref:Uncharacterized protein n=1 Tax=Rhypophila decipiens TaxID=261697 RepID=A0AAN6Y415_9PEZI|nr:hypothetical protein QBC37DRAFT_375646 [Rhypophila decipiens]
MDELLEADTGKNDETGPSEELGCDSAEELDITVLADVGGDEVMPGGPVVRLAEGKALGVLVVLSPEMGPTLLVAEAAVTELGSVGAVDMGPEDGASEELNGRTLEISVMYTEINRAVVKRGRLFGRRRVSIWRIAINYRFRVRLVTVLPGVVGSLPVAPVAPVPVRYANGSPYLCPDALSMLPKHSRNSVQDGDGRQKASGDE